MARQNQRRWSAAQRKKFKQTWAQRRAQAAPEPKTQTNGTGRAKALRRFELTGNAPPAPGQRINGNATLRKPDLESALIHLKRAQDWVIKAMYDGTLRELDPAHRELIQARGALLGLSAP